MLVMIQAVKKDASSDYAPSMMDTPSPRSHGRQQQLPLDHELPMPDYDYHPQQHQQTPPHMHGMPYDPYRGGQPNGGNGLDHQQSGQFYLHEPSPSPRRTWGQPQPLTPVAPPPSMAYQPDAYGMQQQQQQQRRAQWGPPQPVRCLILHASVLCGDFFTFSN